MLFLHLRNSALGLPCKFCLINYLSIYDIALSEAAQAIIENKLLVESSTIFGREVNTKLNEKLATITDNLKNLNSNDKTSNPTANDIYDLMNFILGTDDEYDSFLEEAMQASSALFVLTMQLRAMKSVFLHPESDEEIMQEVAA